MLQNGKELKLSNLLEVKLLQKFQDSFAETMNVACITIDEIGPITKPSNFADFCNLYTTSEIGLKKYNECHLKYGKIAAEKGESVIYTCDTGLTEFIVPIMVADNHIASIIGGQILTETPNEKHFREVARELGINENDYIEALKKIKVATIETVNTAAHLLLTIAHIISDIAHKNLDLIKKNERESFLANIITKAVSTLDINEIKKIVKDVGIMMKADRCYFVEINQEEREGKLIDSDDEYLSSPDIKSAVGYEFPVYDVEKFFKSAKVMASVFDFEKSTKEISENFPEIQKYSEIFSVKSGISVPFMYMNKFKGILSIEYTRENVHPSENELNFLRILGNQMGMAINQIQLYQNIKKTAERESSLREIFEAMRSSLDSNVIKSTIVNELSKALKVDTCSIVTYDSKDDYFYVDEYSEYRSSPEEKSLVNKDEKDPKFKFFVNAFRNNREINFSSVDEFIAANGLQGTPEESFLKEYNIKSGYSIPIYYANSLLGYIIVRYTKDYKVLNENDLDFLRSLATQAGLVINQASLYKKMQLQAERESLLRRIFETMRRSLDANVIKNTIVNEVGKALNIDRCFIGNYDPETDIFDIDKYSEYRSSEDIKSCIGANSQDPKFVDASYRIKNFKEYTIPNYEEYLVKSNLKGTITEDMAKEYNIKSAYGISIFYADILIGGLIIHYTKDYKELDKSDLDFVRTIAAQAGTALYQANLYKKMKTQAEREKFSRNIIEILRNALDKNTIKHLFVQNIGKYFNADRVFFSDFDTEINMYLPVDKNSEYLSSPEEKSFVGYDWSAESISEYIQPLIEKRELKILRWDEYIKENPKSQGFISRFEDANVKSSYNFPVIYQEKMMGYFCIEFTKKVFKLSDEDIINIRSICAQAGIALYHAELFIQIQNHNQNHDL